MTPKRRDTKTRFTGVFARHKEGCATEFDKRCTCKPSYYGSVWDRSTDSRRKTRMHPTPTAAKNARDDLARDLRTGRVPAGDTMRLKDAITTFLNAADQGIALNKHGRRYKPSAVRSMRNALAKVEKQLGSRRIGDIRRGDLQRVVDELTPKLSGSRIRSVVSAVHSLYRWAQARELVYHDPATLVQLPAINASPRDRVATPAELAKLLAALKLEDALPYALSGYATARRAEIRHARVEDVDLKLGVVYLGADERGRKSRAAQRAVPLVKPLVAMLRRRYLERGRPAGRELLCPGHRTGGGHSGMLSFEALQDRADARWKDRGLKRITSHECRHTCATWLDAAGVRPVVVSKLIGHETPVRQPGAPAITQQRYTHVLPGDLERAREALNQYIAREAKAATGS